jgi:predicted Rossmann-fold nucleotide-binding protein
VKDFPVILFGKEYWGGLLGWMHDILLAAVNIRPEDVNNIRVVDEPEEVRDIVVAFHKRARKAKKTP